MPVSAAQQLLEQICSFEGLQTHMEGADAFINLHARLLYHASASGSSMSL